jgi:hypothetical protein
MAPRMCALALWADPRQAEATSPIVTRAHLAELRRFAGAISGHEEQRGCGRGIRRGRPGAANEILNVVATCKRHMLCPTCGYAASCRAQEALARKMGRWTAEGGSLALLTLTARHTYGDRLDTLWAQIEAGWRSLTQGSQWCRVKRRFGIAGYFRVTEVVHSSSSGWNPHFHAVIFLTNQLNEISLQRLRDEAADRFARGVERSGGKAERPGQDLRSIAAMDSRDVAAYCHKGLRIGRSGDSRTPMAILDDLRTGGEGADRWEEFKDAAGPGRRHTVVSHRLDELSPPPLT